MSDSPLRGGMFPQRTQKPRALQTLDQIDMVDIYRVFYPTNRQCPFFSAAHVTFSKLDNILGHKASFNKFKKVKITHYIISYHDRIKLDINNKRIPRKYSNTWRLNNILLNNQWVTKVIREEIKTFLVSNENENTT
jgi:hypothetical protein